MPSNAERYEQEIEDAEREVKEAAKRLEETYDHRKNMGKTGSQRLDERMQAIGDVGRGSDRYKRAQEDIDDSQYVASHKQIPPEKLDDWVFIGFKDGVPQYKRKWLTEVTLGREFTLGGLLHELPIPNTIQGRIIRAERIMGVYIFEKTTAAQGVFTELLHTDVMRNMGALTRQAQLDGIGAYQSATNTALAEKIINTYTQQQQRHPLSVVQKLEGIYEAAAAPQKELLRDFMSERQIGGMLQRDLYTIGNTADHPGIAIPSSDLLFPDLSRSIAPIPPTWDMQDRWVQGYMNQIASTVYDRCILYTGRIK